ncbi:MBL fold metallo-hydrolase [Roseomonas sp. GCM10028921]
MTTAAPGIKAFFDEATNTVSYLVWDAANGAAAVIDPVLDWDNRSGQADTRSADAVLRAATEKGLRLEWVLETHAHADHLTAAPYIKQRTGAPIGIGARITEVQRIFRPVFDARDLRPDGADFDRLFADGEPFPLGGLEVEVLHVPGHTPADVAYRIGNVVFVGDTLFMPDSGTARADFPGGDAHALYRSIKRLLALPPETRIFTCHDYKAPGRDRFAWETTVAEQRAANIHVGAGRTEEEFVALRTKRDATLAAPTLLLPSIQVNIRAGRFPGGVEGGPTFLLIPVAGKGIVPQHDEAAETRP